MIYNVRHMEKRLTQTSTITSKYQTVIPASIRKALKLKVSGELIWQVLPQAERPLILVMPKTKNWSKYLSGLGKHVWSGVDTESYLKQLKTEWRK